MYLMYPTVYKFCPFNYILRERERERERERNQALFKNNGCGTSMVHGWCCEAGCHSVDVRGVVGWLRSVRVRTAVRVRTE
jgi:hypothetical protein